MLACKFFTFSILFIIFSECSEDSEFSEDSDFQLSIFNLLYPTLPSSDTDSNFCASTANSMGNLLMTSLA